MGLNEKSLFEKGTVNGQGNDGQDGSGEEQSPESAGGEITPQQDEQANDPDRSQEQTGCYAPAWVDSKAGQERSGGQAQDVGGGNDVDASGGLAGQVAGQEQGGGNQQANGYLRG